MVVVLLLVVAGVLWRWRCECKAVSTDSSATRDAISALDLVEAKSSQGSARHRDPTPANVRRISPEQRQQLAAAIAHATRSRGSLAPSLPPSAADNVAVVTTSVRDAMRQVMSFLAECYEAQGSALPKHTKVVAMLSFTGDPNVGTLIDTKSLADENQGPVLASFEKCLRDAFASLELPPLSEGDRVEVSYPLEFTASE